MAWAPDYVTVEEIRAYREIEDLGDDAELMVAVTAASRSIDRFCNRQFGVVDSAEARRFQAEYNRRQRRWEIRIDDLMDLTGLVVEFDLVGDLSFSTSVPVSDLDFWPTNAAQKGQPWTRIVLLDSASVDPNDVDGAVRNTALWGWTAFPDTVKEATMIQASRLIARRRSQFGEFGSVDPSPEVPAAWDTMRAGPGVSLDPEVRVMLGKYKRNWGAR